MSARDYLKSMFVFPSILIFDSDKPSPPRNLQVVSFGKDFVELKWDVPESDGGEQITGYLVERRDASKTAYIKQGTTDAKTLTIKATKLIEGTKLIFRVFAINSIDQSEPTELSEPVITKVPFNPPDSPINLRAEEVTKTSATIRWAPPENDGGSPVTGYFVERSTNGKWVKINRKSVAECELAMDDLKENVKYGIRVSAENAAGVGKPCNEISFVAKSEFDVPGKPGQPEVSNVMATTLLLTWTAPKTDGGTPITNYIVEMKRKGDVTWKIVNQAETLTDTKYAVKELQTEVDYEFRVTAENKVGKGEPSAPSKTARCGESSFSVTIYLQDVPCCFLR